MIKCYITIAIGFGSDLIRPCFCANCYGARL